jgi:hypothetical protein
MTRKITYGRRMSTKKSRSMARQIEKKSKEKKKKKKKR